MTMLSGFSQASPRTFAQQIPKDGYIGRTKCPRSAEDTPANECLVFRGNDAEMFYVHRPSCQLEHVDMQNKNGPVAAEIYWLVDTFKLGTVEPVATLSMGLSADMALMRKLADGEGAVDHDFHSRREFVTDRMSKR